MSNPLVFTPNGACNNLVVLRGIVPGASYDHTWYVEDWDCVNGVKLRDANYTGAAGFVLWFSDESGNLILTHHTEETEGLPENGKVRFNVTPAETELLRGLVRGDLGMGWVDSLGRQLPVESGRFHVEEWPAIQWRAGA